MNCKKEHNYIVAEKSVWERAGGYYRNIVVDLVLVCTRCGDTQTERRYIQGDIEDFKRVNQSR